MGTDDTAELLREVRAVADRVGDIRVAIAHGEGRSAAMDARLVAQVADCTAREVAVQALEQRVRAVELSRSQLVGLAAGASGLASVIAVLTSWGISLVGG